MAEKVTLEFGPWEPDAALLDGQQAPEACNVIPSKRGYRPFPGIEADRWPALGRQAMEMFSCRSINGDTFTTAAASNGIYQLELENGAWVWKSRYSDTALTTDRWFAQYGDEVFALFGTQLVKQSSPGTAYKPITTAQGFVADAPSAARLGTIRDFLVLGCLSSNQQAIQWSGIDRPDTWYAPGSNAAQYIQSDIQVFPVGGKVQSIVGAVGGVDGIIFLERAIQRATYVGPPYIFQFDPVDWQQGTIAPKSPVVCGNACYFLSEDGWKATDGAGVKGIGIERIDRWFFEECNMERAGEVRGVHDFQRRLAVWSFPSMKAKAGQHDRLLIYSYDLDRWSYAALSGDGTGIECMYAEFSHGTTLEELDAYFPTDGTATGGIDTQPAPFTFDSVSLRGGDRILGCVTAAHKVGAFTGAAMEAVIDTAEHGSERMMVHGFRPLVDSGAAQAQPLYRQREMDPKRTERPYTAQSRMGICYQHLSANYVAARVKVPAEETWTHAVGVEMLFEKEGGM